MKVSRRVKFYPRALRAKSLFAISIAVVLSSCISSVPRASKPSIRDGIAAALIDPSVSDYRRASCLDSLRYWSEEGVEVPEFDASRDSGSMFFLGDSYISYSFIFLGTKHGYPSMIHQNSDTSKKVDLTANKLAELVRLIGTAKHDPPPKRLSAAVHKSCAVFQNATGKYFAVQFDETPGSSRATDRASEFVERRFGDAP